MSFNQSGTFIYSPDISVAIHTVNNGVIDVSADIVNFQMSRQINSVSSFSCTLNNPLRKYNRMINTMDRITVFLKRTQFIQCFTGLVTYAPIETLVPTPITIQASCTLYILQNTYWDDTLLEFQQLLLNMFDQTAQSTDQTQNDGGVGQALVNVLYRVAGWNPDKIHVQGIPQKFINNAVQVYKNIVVSSELDQASVVELAAVLSANSITAGKSVVNGAYTINGLETLDTSSAPNGGVGVSVSASQAGAFLTSPIVNSKQNFPGPNTQNPVNINQITQDIYYCSAPWSYLAYQNMSGLTNDQKKKNQEIIDNAKNWLSINPATGNNDGRLLIVCNQQTNRTVAVRATSIPQQPNESLKGYAVYAEYVNFLQLHPSVVAYLNGKVGDPTAWKSTIDPGVANVTFQWADSTKVTQAGKLPDLNSPQAKRYLDSSQTSLGDASVVNKALDTLVFTLVGQLGDSYSETSSGRKNPGAYGTGTGSFDCSGLAAWAYSKININLQGWPYCNTWSIYGPQAAPGASSSGEYMQGANPETYGQWIPNTQQPQKGDLIFWEVPLDAQGVPPNNPNLNAPQHVSIMVSNFGDPGPAGTKFADAKGSPDIGYLIESSGGSLGPNIQQISWSAMANGQWLYPGQSYTCRSIGCRRPITLHPVWGQAAMQNFSIISSMQTNIAAPGTSTGTNPSTANGATSQTTDPNNANQRATISIANSFNNLMQMPNYDVRASSIVGTPRAFLLDNPVMQDITQIIGSGLRQYMSAPNGDFIAWFPDWYGVYGTDPVLEISPVEIIDFQIYHDDTQLATHVGIVGDTNGIGQQVSFGDYITTNGIVSVQDVSTMRILFGNDFSQNTGADVTATIAYTNFLNRYGIRPFVQEQNMIHSHIMEYMYALYTFMNQWANQFSSNIQLTFMPELYPGMRVFMNLDDEQGGTVQYKFYCTAVQHSGDRTNGFTTQATFTAPMKGNSIMHYGLNIGS